MWNVGAEAEGPTATAIFFAGLLLLLLGGYLIRRAWAIALPLLPLLVFELVGLSYAQGPGFWGEAWFVGFFFVALISAAALGVGQLLGMQYGARRRSRQAARRRDQRTARLRRS